MKVPVPLRGKDKNETVIARTKSVWFTLCSVIIPFDVLAVTLGTLQLYKETMTSPKSALVNHLSPIYDLHQCDIRFCHDIPTRFT